MVDFYKAELERCKKALTETDPHNYEEYRALLGTISTLTYNLQIEDHPELFTVPGSARVDVVSDGPVAETAPVAEPTEPDTPTEPDEEPEPEKAPEATAPSLKREDVMSILSPLAASGVNISKVMKGMGFSKLSQIPTERYQELIDLAKAAAEESVD